MHALKRRFEAIDGENKRENLGKTAGGKNEDGGAATGRGGRDVPANTKKVRVTERTEVKQTRKKSTNSANTGRGATMQGRDNVANSQGEETDSPEIKDDSLKRIKQEILELMKEEDVKRMEQANTKQSKEKNMAQIEEQRKKQLLGELKRIKKEMQQLEEELNWT